VEYEFKVCGTCKKLFRSAEIMCSCGNKDFIHITNEQKEKAVTTVPFGQILTEDSFISMFLVDEPKKELEDIIDENQLEDAEIKVSSNLEPKNKSKKK
jgi:hypothetical protein